MKSSFTATIYKTGINLCVDVPEKITSKMVATKGYIPIKGKINNHPFTQTLVPVKNKLYRLFVNGIMLKGSGTKLGDTVKFSIEQNFDKREEPFPPAFKKELTANKLLWEFNKLTPARKKEILRYLNHFKTEEILVKNIDKVIQQLKKSTNDNKGFLRTLNNTKTTKRVS
jgi:hypothetical protein